ncbi:hypothetical protein GOBAR_AA00868 [Gossypium barbadense]|uniref:Uncharacterized protein n=1 Tax=Gossypium barbadense TaxID=3634 RepID=A0A2P5YVQ8_GOSBA|nr:hypothetical protein GOBAR_AA00868 [Gossypium barbadense]
MQRTKATKTKKDGTKRETEEEKIDKRGEGNACRGKGQSRRAQKNYRKMHLAIIGQEKSKKMNSSLRKQRKLSSKSSEK